MSRNTFIDPEGRKICKFTGSVIDRDPIDAEEDRMIEMIGRAWYITPREEKPRPSLDIACFHIGFLIGVIQKLKQKNYQ